MCGSMEVMNQTFMTTTMLIFLMGSWSNLLRPSMVGRSLTERTMYSVSGVYIVKEYTGETPVLPTNLWDAQNQSADVESPRSREEDWVSFHSTNLCIL
jgi:hypothetical protein